MPGSPSKLSRALCNVREQLKSQTTRGKNPRPLTAEETQTLEKKRDELQAQLKEAAKERAIARIARHTTAEADRVVEAVREDGEGTRRALQPLTSLVAGDESKSPDERIAARRNQIALLRAGVRADLEEKRQAREAAKAAAPPSKRIRRSVADDGASSSHQTLPTLPPPTEKVNNDTAEEGGQSDEEAEEEGEQEDKDNDAVTGLPPDADTELVDEAAEAKYAKKLTNAARVEEYQAKVLQSLTSLEQLRTTMKYFGKLYDADIGDAIAY